MSLHKTLTTLLGPNYRIRQSHAVQHGEPGRKVVVSTRVRDHEFFFADDRKITEDQAASIILSYLRGGA